MNRMNPRPEPGALRVQCLHCLKMVDAYECWVDPSGPPFRAYYHEECTQDDFALREHATNETFQIEVTLSDGFVLTGSYMKDPGMYCAARTNVYERHRRVPKPVIHHDPWLSAWDSH